MTPASIPDDRGKDLGITYGFIRASVENEDGEDLTDDVEQSLK